MAGLVCYYNGEKFHCLYISFDEELGKHIRVMSCLPDRAQSNVFSEPVPIPANKPLILRAEMDYERLLFAFKFGDSDWQWLPGSFDASALADEAGPQTNPNFTGAFIGMCCQDMSGEGRYADFDYFSYREREYLASPEL